MMKTRLGWILIGVLSLALVGQVVAYRLQTPASTMRASWTFRPKTLAEARGKATAIVLAEVVTAERGEDLVAPAKGEPNDEDRIPTQRITLKVLKGYKGAAKSGQTLTLFQTGGTVAQAPSRQAGKQPLTTVQQVILEGDPLYRQGEQYLLMLEPGPRGMLRTISPEGRYRVERNGALTAMVDDEATREIQGKALSDVEQTLASAK